MYKSRRGAYFDLKCIAKRSKNNKKTSFTIRNLTLRKVEKEKQDLLHRLRFRKIHIRLIQGEIEKLCLYLLTEGPLLKSSQCSRMTLYNDKGHDYQKVNLTISNHEQHYEFRRLSLIHKASLSQLIDIAVRLYLKMAIRIIYLQFAGNFERPSAKQMNPRYKELCLKSIYSSVDVDLATSIAALTWRRLI